MEKFSATDAAFTGFRIVREQPMAVVLWAATQLVTSLILVGVLMVTAGPALTEFSRMSLEGRQDPSAALDSMRRQGPIYVGILVYVLAFYAVAWAAMNRAVLRPAESRFGYLRFGADELRQLGVMLLFILALVGVELIAVLAAVLIGLVLALVSEQAAAFVPVITIFCILGAIAYVACRLSLSSPLTFDTGRVRLFGSWALTKRRFWPMFGCYALTCALALVVGLLGLVIQVCLGAALGGGLQSAAGELVKPDLGSLASRLRPAQLASAVVGAGLMAILLPVMMTPAAAIYRAVTRTSAASVAETF